MHQPSTTEAHYVPMRCCGGRRGMRFWGGVMLAMGLILLLTQFSLLPPVVYDMFGPAFLLALGAWVLLEARGSDAVPFDRGRREGR